MAGAPGGGKRTLDSSSCSEEREIQPEMELKPWKTNVDHHIFSIFKIVFSPISTGFPVDFDSKLSSGAPHHPLLGLWVPRGGPASHRLEDDLLTVDVQVVFAQQHQEPAGAQVEEPLKEAAKTHMGR